MHRTIWLGFWVFLCPVLSSGDEAGFSRDLPVVVDTQVTESDEIAMSLPTPDQPVYYNLATYGYVLFGDFLGADEGPDRERFLRQVIESLRTVGYAPADDANPASVTVGVTWGSIVDDLRVANRYFSGQQHAIHWQTQPLIAQNRAYSPGFDWAGLDRTSYNQVLAVMRDDSLVVMLTVSEWHEKKPREKQIYWQTRAMVRSRNFESGWALAKAVEVMTPYLGQHATHPVVEIVPRGAEIRSSASETGSIDFSQLVIHDYGSR